MNKLIGEEKIDEAVLDVMRRRGGQWAAYQNHALDSADCGRLTFLQIGPDKTFKTPPPHFPDSAGVGPGWKYLHVGFVDLETGKIKVQ